MGNQENNIPGRPTEHLAITSESITTEAREGVLTKGTERADNLIKTISAKKEQLGGWVKSGFSAMGRMFRKGVNVAFSAPEIAQAVNAKVEAGLNIADSKIVEAGKAIDTKIVQGLDYADNAIRGAGNAIDSNVVRFEGWLVAQKDEAADWTGKRIEDSKIFLQGKAQQAIDLGTSSLETAQIIGSMIAEKTSEKVGMAKDAVVNKFNTTVEYGKNCIDGAKLRASEAKKGFLTRWYNACAEIARKKMEKNHANYERFQQKLAQFNGLEAVTATA